MESRKEKEINYYDAKASVCGIKDGDFEGFDPFILNSYIFLKKLLEDKCGDKKVLDYGCGNGIHSVWLAKSKAEVKAIDLSENSLQIAGKRAMIEKVEDKIEFYKMDCEKMEFDDSSFDIIFDGGTFSSLDLKSAWPELLRVLKPNGCLIGIETFGHNPLANFKRLINKVLKKRTNWAASHIFKMKDLKEAEKYFNKIDVYSFHIVSCLIFPFLNLPLGKTLLRLFERLDKMLFKAPFLKRYAFKIVFVFSEPKK
ncbi:MAG: class I SAM-dependent methyltransferase [Candidatus Pacebacteria bacterium]|nr:class I SAM-dependent methyltransferase [Candidatus Paceibacterota bacterium]